MLRNEVLWDLWEVGDTADSNMWTCSIRISRPRNGTFIVGKWFIYSNGWLFSDVK